MSNHAQSDLISVPKLQKTKGEAPVFTVAHYAGKVTYDTTLFLPKNTDPLHPELLEMMQGSASAYLAGLFAPPKETTNATGGGTGRGGGQGKRGALFSQTVGSRFKEQLTGLMESIAVTQVHYIRCVKPNAASKPHEFTKELVSEQLRCAGMLEAVRISRAAYPHRLPRGAVAKRFGPVAREEQNGGDLAAKALYAAVEPRHMTTPQLRAALGKAGIKFADSEASEELVTRLEGAGTAGLQALLGLLLPDGGPAHVDLTR